MKLKANRGDIPTVCPKCGYGTDDPEEMVEHWRQAGELNFNGNMVEVPRGGRIMVAQPKVVADPISGLSKFSVEELLQRKDTLPWWLGLGLIAMALTIPGDPQYDPTACPHRSTGSSLGYGDHHEPGGGAGVGRSILGS